MASLDESTADLLAQILIQDSNMSSGLNGMADRNSVQGLTTIGNTVIQSVAATADDAQLMAAQNTAVRTPGGGTGGGT